MSLSAGTRLGSYEIIAPIGAGGMGEVYRARDPKLNREVAIKVLPERLAQDPTALARFEREAQAIAALSHPNILAIFDFGTERGITYAVSELLEGETLRARLSQGALPVRKAVDFGVHIVRGIAAAHERGIVHRDLKPENVFITRDGVVKILDFGLAKAREGREGSQGSEGAGATRMADTTPGTVLGTVGYMSPEQVRGQAIDHRTDIFSAGAILFEMLTGRRAFRGDSHVETMNAILKEDPPEFSEFSPNLPGSLERIVRRCLEKQPSDRFHSAHDLAIALEALSGASSHSSTSMAAAAAALPAPRRKLGPVVAVAAVILVGTGAFFAGRGLSAPEAPAPPDLARLTYRRGPVRSARMAPDGATFLYSAIWEGSPLQVYSTRSESPESLALPYVNADVVSVSQTGELAIVSNRRGLNAFARVGTLARAPISGGAARDVLEDVQDADWLPDGSGFAVSHFVDGKYRVEFPIGKVVYETSGWVSHVRVSPDGRQVAFLDQPLMGDDRGSLALVDTAGKKQSVAVECESTQGLAWAPSGQEVWFTCASRGLWRSLLAASLDGRVRSVLRVPGSLFLGDIGKDGTVLISHDSSRRGVIALAPGETKERDISWLDWTQPMALSDDGRTLLIGEEGEGGGPGYATFIRKTDGSPAVRLGSGEGIALSADGRWVIAQKLNPSPVQFVLMPTGAGEVRALTNDDITHLLGSFLPDGRRFVFSGFKPNQRRRVWVQPLDGGLPTPITPETVDVADRFFVTPDGKRVLVRLGDGRRMFYTIDTAAGSAGEELKTLLPDDGLLRYTADGNGVFVRRPPAADGVVSVVRVDIRTGARTPVRSITPSAGAVGGLLISADAKAYVYSYGVTQSDLFLVKGLK